LVTNSDSNLARGRKHFSQLFNVHGVSDVRQIEIHTAETLMPEPSAFEVEMVLNPSAWGHLNPSSYCDVGRLFYGVFKLWSKLQRKKMKK